MSTRKENYFCRGSKINILEFDSMDRVNFDLSAYIVSEIAERIKPYFQNCKTKFYLERTKYQNLDICIPAKDQEEFSYHNGTVHWCNIKVNDTDIYLRLDSEEFDYKWDNDITDEKLDDLTRELVSRIENNKTTPEDNKLVKIKDKQITELDNYIKFLFEKSKLFKSLKVFYRKNMLGEAHKRNQVRYEYYYITKDDNFIKLKISLSSKDCERVYLVIKSKSICELEMLIDTDIEMINDDNVDWNP